MKKLATSEFDDEDVGFEKLSSRKRTKRIIIALTVVLLLLFVLCLIFIVLFALEKSKVHEQESPPQVQKICDSRRCLFAAVGKLSLLLKYFYLMQPGSISRRSRKGFTPGKPWENLKPYKAVLLTYS